MANTRREPRTMLEYLIQQRDRTYEELAERFLRLEEPATISARHLGRLARGERGSAGTTPATRRALQAMFGMSLEELLRPWAPEIVTAKPAMDDGSLVLPSPGNERSLIRMAAERARRFTLLAAESTTPRVQSRQPSVRRANCSTWRASQRSSGPASPAVSLAQPSRSGRRSITGGMPVGARWAARRSQASATARMVAVLQGGPAAVPGANEVIRATQSPSCTTPNRSGAGTSTGNARSAAASHRYSSCEAAFTCAETALAKTRRPSPSDKTAAGPGDIPPRTSTLATSPLPSSTDTRCRSRTGAHVHGTRTGN